MTITALCVPAGVHEAARQQSINSRYLLVAGDTTLVLLSTDGTSQGHPGPVSSQLNCTSMVRNGCVAVWVMSESHKERGEPC